MMRVLLRWHAELGNAPLANVQVVNELVGHNSEHTCLVFLTLPSLPVSTNMTDDAEIADVRHRAATPPQRVSCVPPRA